ncbi:MAG: TonB-dependent receptor [Woeseiaceae bacterium]|nr:TonB-dependent receptor [Woeseiaceae bacterium]
MWRNLCAAAATIIIAAQTSAASAQAATKAASQSEEAVEEIVVTGSRIARRDFFSVSPITSFDRSEISLSGNVEIARLTNALPQIDPGVGSGAGNGFEGTTRINLRALGDQRTLTLLNGRRYATNSIFGAVDLNALPPAIIERVEVITGGASAVYGSDALAGAVNFILRNDFEGLETSIQYDVTERGDGDTYNVDIAYGMPIADGRGNLVLIGNYYDRDVIFQADRSFSAMPMFANNNTGEIVDDRNIVSGAGTFFGSFGQLFSFDPDGTPRPFIEPDDLFNQAAETALRAPMERYSANLFSHLDIGESNRLSLELMYTHSEPVQRRGDIFVGFVDINVDRPDISPAFQSLLASDLDFDGDGIASIFFGRRFTEERGPAINTNEREFYRAMLGWEGGRGRDWTWSVDYSYTETSLDNRTTNDSSVSRIQQGLLVDPLTGQCFDTSNGCVPVNPFGVGNLSAAAAEFISLSPVGRDESAEQQLITAVLRGSPLSIWAGDIDLALGAEYRKDKIAYVPTESILSGDSVFWGSDVIARGSVAIKELFAEARVPLAQGTPWAEYLGLEIGARVSDYDYIDDTFWTWKIGGEWQLPYGVRFRAMSQRAIRAPNAGELFQESQPAGINFQLGPIFDECSASRDPVGNGLSELCIAQGIPADQVGVFEASFFPTRIEFQSNPNLQPEESDSFTAGVVWQPEFWSRANVSVDYFDIEIDNASALISPNDAVSLCFVTADPTDEFCTKFSRGPSLNIESAILTFINAAKGRSKGLDVALDTSWDVDSMALFNGAATLDLSFVATRYLEVGVQPSPLVPFIECRGQFGGLCDEFLYFGSLPELRTNTRLTYSSGPMRASLRWQYIDSLTNGDNEFREAVGRPPGTPAVQSIGSHSYFDLTIDAEIGERWNMRFGIENLADKQPPFVGTGRFRDANTDASTYDLLGRRYFLRLTLSM